MLYISGPLAPPFVSSTFFTQGKGCYIWTKKPRSLPQKTVIHGSWTPYIGAIKFGLLTKSTYSIENCTCYYIQAWLERQCTVLKERMKKRLWILTFSMYLYITFQTGGQQTKRYCLLLEMACFQTLSSTQAVREHSRSNMAGQGVICHPFVSALWSSGWIASWIVHSDRTYLILLHALARGSSS